MGDYGTHPTRYGNLTNDDLYAMYRDCVYSRLDAGEKLDLLQETVNRDARELGESGAPKVEFDELPAGVSGEARGGVIRIDYHMAVHGMQSATYEGRTVTYAREDYNIQALNTALHENAHCYQEQVTDGTICIPDSRLTAEYQANGFTESAVLRDESYRLGSQYLTGETPNGYCMYYFQATERDAYRWAEIKTNFILQDLTEKYGTEPSFEAYAKDLEVNGYQAMEQKALELFDNPNFEANLNQVLCNQYYGTNVPVNREIEEAVKREMEASYRKLQSQYEKQEAVQNEEADQKISSGSEKNEEANVHHGEGRLDKQNSMSIEGEKNMGFDAKPVSLEEYNQTLRETVNGYYTHAMNDPSMSREEAIRSTGEMAEKYLEAVEEFEAAQNAQQGMAGTANGGLSEMSGTQGMTGMDADGGGSGSSMEGGSPGGGMTGGVESEGSGVNDGDGVSGDAGIGNGGADTGDGLGEDGLDGDGLDGCDDGMDP